MRACLKKVLQRFSPLFHRRQFVRIRVWINQSGSKNYGTMCVNIMGNILFGLCGLDTKLYWTSLRYHILCELKNLIERLKKLLSYLYLHKLETQIPNPVMLQFKVLILYFFNLNFVCNTIAEVLSELNPFYPTRFMFQGF